MLRSRLHRLRPLPEVSSSDLLWTENVDVLRRITALGYLLAAGTSLLSIVTPDPDTSDHRALAILAVLEIACGLILAFGARLPDAVIRAIALPGAVIFTSLAVAFARPAEVVLLFYLWPALQVGFFGTRRDLQVTGVTFLVGLAFALHAGPWQVPFMTYLVTVDVMVVAAVVIFALRRYGERLVTDLEAAATHDDLTGLLNRRAFTNALERELLRSQSTGAPVSLVLFDLDHFKRINDDHGHAAGDRALCLVAEVLTEIATEIDAVGRHGGEEFTLLLPGTGLRDAAAVAQRVSERLEARSRATPIPLSTSAGVAASGPGRRDVEPLLAAADHALYAAKQAGRRRVFVAPDITPALAAA